MLKFLDIILSPADLERVNQQRNRHFFEVPRPEQNKPSIEIDRFFDSVQNATYTVPDTVPIKNITTDAVADSVTNKQGVIDTLQASGTLTGGFGSNGGDSTLLWTALVVIAVLGLCFWFVWLYRRHLKYAQ